LKVVANKQRFEDVKVPWPTTLHGAEPLLAVFERTAFQLLKIYLKKKTLHNSFKAIDETKPGFQLVTGQGQ
jgi:sulfatase maturation enzyme AslB (radical SAM superfamily)